MKNMQVEKQINLKKEDKLELHNSELQCQVYRKDIQSISDLLAEEQKNFQMILTRLLGDNNKITGINFKEGIIKYTEIPVEETNPATKK